MTNQILDIFETFRIPPLSIDQYNQTGKAILSEKIESFIKLNKQINFVMLGFPMKSINDRDKVLGKLPDLGEELAFKNFADFARQIKDIYAPGININIVSDGYIFNDIMGAEDKTVAAYEEICKDLARVAPITYFDLFNFTTSREKVMEQFGINSQELEHRILFDHDTNVLYKGMIRFLSLDLAINKYDSGNQLHKAAKSMAREMMFRNEAYSRLVQKEFSGSIRLSMHPSLNNGVKYSFQLIKSCKVWTSPWHSALVIHPNGQPESVHKMDAMKAGYVLQYKNNQPYNYTTL